MFVKAKTLPRICKNIYICRYFNYKTFLIYLESTFTARRKKNVEFRLTFLNNCKNLCSKVNHCRNNKMSAQIKRLLKVVTFKDLEENIYT